MKYYIHVIKNYATFSGRARRTEYWMFVLFNIIFTSVFTLLDYFFGLNSIILNYGPFYILYFLFIFIPYLAVVVRRLHDVGKSGWYYLLVFLPIIGWIWLFVLLVTDSQKGENKWGKNPKGQNEKEYFSGE